MRLSDLQKRLLVNLRPDLLPNLVAYWNFDGNGTDSVNSITPTLETNVTYNNDSILGTSAAITANNAVLKYADRDDFSFTDGTNDLPFSISFWVFFTGFSSSVNNLVLKRQQFTGTNAEWSILRANSTTRIIIAKRSKHNVTIIHSVSTSANAFNLNSWYHIVATDNPTNISTENNLKIYVNGVEDSDSRETNSLYQGMGNTTSQLAMLNADANAALANSHQGRLDEVAIWKNRELTPKEVLYLYNAGAGRTYPL